MSAYVLLAKQLYGILVVHLVVRNTAYIWEQQQGDTASFASGKDPDVILNTAFKLDESTLSPKGNSNMYLAIVAQGNKGDDHQH
ncbi:predicted protein [Lichtheimia corymbifera JMRC:FSU:9682]|uniref:Uncharacterized protein n=1 Tax=Lichtheimia corymbifera JMRC:FSU:9682 TaxID=1263082 RepID=A0A068SHL1_9FUNG|nr:predicted protein [Lichtheimia corymbifera JMRC:FSU:9682]